MGLECGGVWGMTLNIRDRAYQILRDAYGSNATFRDGQLEAIESVLGGVNSLVVQKTGWGKSLVYFIATKILREHGAGPTLIVSPLLALMGNQIEAAQLLDMQAATINSANRDWHGWRMHSAKANSCRTARALFIALLTMTAMRSLST
jgi:superfamily II DNA helicase RecQ